VLYMENTSSALLKLKIFNKLLMVRIRIMVLNATFNNISAISWRSVLLVK